MSKGNGELTKKKKTLEKLWMCQPQLLNATSTFSEY